MIANSTVPVLGDFAIVIICILIYISSSSSLNIYVVTSAKALVFDITDLTAGFQEGYEVPQIIEPRLRNIENLVYSKAIVPPTIKKSLDVGNVNARSLRNKTEVFIDLLITESIDVCVVTETLAALSPKGYIFKNVPRESVQFSSIYLATIHYEVSIKKNYHMAREPRNHGAYKTWTPVLPKRIQNRKSLHELMDYIDCLNNTMFSLFYAGNKNKKGKTSESD